MERILRTVLIVTAAIAAACAPRERTLVLLSTNDMHAKIQHFPRLAAAVEACRDTAQLVVLVDAGDRWTGNAYVDRAATPGMPMIALMNGLGYDVATLGNHEFDHGQAFLGRMIDSMDFEVVCANVVSDTCSFPPLPPYTVLEEGGLRIGFVGVVTNYEGPGHPAGNASSFAGLTFPDPQRMALKYAAELRPKCDVLVLVSHMGDDRDRELLAGGASQYDVVIGGHTHEEVDTLIGGTLLTQTGKDLRNIGVTTIRMKGKKVAGVDFRLVPLAGYEPDPVFQKQVDACYANPELNRPMGGFGNAANKWGLANWMAGAVADGIDAEIGFYHIGGVRLDSIPAGGVSAASVYGLEPFGDRPDADDSGRHAAGDRFEVQRHGEPQGGAPHRPDFDNALCDRYRSGGQCARRGVPQAARREGLHGRRQRLRLQELQRPELHRRQDYRRGCDRDSARRAGGGLSAPDRQHAAAAGAAEVGLRTGRPASGRNSGLWPGACDGREKHLRRCSGCATGRPESVRARRRSRPGRARGREV